MFLSQSFSVSEISLQRGQLNFESFFSLFLICMEGKMFDLISMKDEAGMTGLKILGGRLGKLFPVHVGFA